MHYPGDCLQIIRAIVRTSLVTTLIINPLDSPEKSGISRHITFALQTNQKTGLQSVLGHTCIIPNFVEKVGGLDILHPTRHIMLFIYEAELFSQ